MGTNADVKLSPWHPIKDAVDLKHLGKLAEELGEAVSAVNRCIIQGLRDGEVHPETGYTNISLLEDEIADVLAGIKLCVKRFGLDARRIEERTEQKINRLREWYEMA